MAKKYSINRISKRKVYSAKEIAELLSVHSQTVHLWLSQGLETVERSFPYLIYGEGLAKFLGQRQAKRKVKLADDEFYCVRCHKARKGVSAKTQTVITNKKIGIDKIFIHKQSECEVCGSQINRFGAKYRADVRELLGNGSNPANIEIEKGEV